LLERAFADDRAHVRIGQYRPPLTREADVLGVARLQGTLRVSLAAGYVPKIGDTFTLVTHATREGAFEEIVVPPTSGRLRWEVRSDPTSITLVAEPALESVEPIR